MLHRTLIHSIRKASSAKQFFKISEEVQAALSDGVGVVALESTIIAHGLPKPLNLETALNLERIIRAHGAVPATIAILDGKICVGLEKNELELLAESKRAAKISRRDIASCIAKKTVGATTVASTMWAANEAGIRVFATGGIGGVHRFAEQTFDISADLQELASTPVTVVCAGAKSILDIDKTLEYLETHSVNTIVYSKYNVFPEFFVPGQTRKAQYATTDLKLIAQIIDTSNNLGLQAGTLLACPIPEEFAADSDVINSAIHKALEEIKKQNISGQKTTPYILKRVAELTGGHSVESNIALVKNNAEIAAKLSNILAANKARTSKIIASDVEKKKKIPKVVTIGAAICDFEAITPLVLQSDGGSYSGRIIQRPGGVGRNHADALARLGLNSVLITCVGDDHNGEFLRRTGQHIDMTNVETVVDVPSAAYLSVNSKGNILYGISSIETIMEHLCPKFVEKNADVISTADLIVLDGNLRQDAFDQALELARKYSITTWFEPTDIKKMQKLENREDLVQITSPNLNEFRTFCRHHPQLADADVTFPNPEQIMNFVHENQFLMHNFSHLIVTMAEQGVVIFTKDTNGNLHCSHTPAPQVSNIVSASGAGDSWNSGFIAGMLTGAKDSIALANQAASLTLKSEFAVSPAISRLRVI